MKSKSESFMSIFLSQTVISKAVHISFNTTVMKNEFDSARSPTVRYSERRVTRKPSSSNPKLYEYKLLGMCQVHTYMQQVHQQQSSSCCISCWLYWDGHQWDMTGHYQGQRNYVCKDHCYCNCSTHVKMLHLIHMVTTWRLVHEVSMMNDDTSWFQQGSKRPLWFGGLKSRNLFPQLV